MPDRGSSPIEPSRHASAPGTHHAPPSAHTNSHIQTFIQEAIEATNPSLRHLASHSSLGSQTSHHSRSTSVTKSRARVRPRPLSTLAEQRHPGKPAVSITRSTKDWDPETIAKGDGSTLFTSDDMTLFSDRRSSVVDTSLEGSRKYEEVDVPDVAMRSVIESDGTSERVDAENLKAAPAGEDENHYPGLLGLGILITGIALSVFLISLDRTIITTVSCSILYVARERELISAGDSIHLERIQILRRHRMVWFRVPPHSICIPASVWKDIHAVQHEMDISSLTRSPDNECDGIRCNATNQTSKLEQSE